MPELLEDVDFLPERLEDLVREVLVDEELHRDVGLPIYALEHLAVCAASNPGTEVNVMDVDLPLEVAVRAEPPSIVPVGVRVLVEEVVHIVQRADMRPRV